MTRSWVIPMTDAKNRPTKLRVETARAVQRINCPECGTERRVYIRDESVGGIICTGCEAEIEFVYDREDEPEVEDTTEQSGLEAF